MVVEGAGGGWGDDAERVWSTIARGIATTSGEQISSVTAELYQSLSLILHREGARAVLRWLPGTVSDNVMASAQAALDCAPRAEDIPMD